MLDKGEGQILFTHGIEGMHFRKTADGYEMLPEPANPDRPFDKAFSDPTLIMNGWEPLVPLNDLIELSRKIHRENSIQLTLPEGGDTYVKYVGELMTMKQEVFSKIVVGDLSVDAGLAEYRRIVGIEADTVRHYDLGWLRTGLTEHQHGGLCDTVVDAEPVVLQKPPL